MATAPQQMNLQTFLDSVAKLPKGKTGFQSTNWDALLNKKVVGWKSVVQDSANWDDLAEKTNPIRDRTELVVTMLNLVGTELFKIFALSSNGQTKHGAREWLFRISMHYNTKIPDAIRTWFKEKQELLASGHALPEFPKVEISHDDPPAFRENPELRKRYEEDINPVGDRNDDGDRNDINKDIEGLLGVYIWKEKHIIIWRKGVELCSRANQLPHQDLFNCVLVHELGHWFNAEATVANGVQWDLSPIILTAANDEQPAHPNINTPNASLPTKITGDARSLSSRCYHEAWAQLFAWLYGREKDAGVLAAFEALEKGQSKPYRAWRQLVSNISNPGLGPYTLNDLRWSQDCILKSLECSRSLKNAKGDPTPATFADSNFSRTNMIGWLNKHCKTVQPAASTD